VDQGRHPGDDQRHDRRKLVEAEVEGDPEVAGGDPLVATEHHGALVGGVAEQLEERRHGQHERDGHQGGGQPPRSPAEAPPDQDVDGEASRRQQRQQREQAERTLGVQGTVTP
jgi:hypothetical protein